MAAAPCRRDDDRRGAGAVNEWVPWLVKEDAGGSCGEALWTPFFNGVTKREVGMTKREVGMTA